MNRLLITSNATNGGGIYLLDPNPAKGSITRIYDQPTHGITRGPDGYYFVENFGSVFHLEPETWKVTKRAETGFRGCHDLKYTGDDFYLVASTGNWVARLDRDIQVRDKMQIVKSDTDVCHANCLVEADGQLLVSIFTLVIGPRMEKRFTTPWRRAGKIIRLNWEQQDFDILYEPLCQPHSLVWKDKQLYCCESYTSELSVMSLAQRTRSQLREVHGFLRGLAFSNGNAYVGISNWQRERSRVKAFFDRYRLSCGVLELEPGTWRTRRSFQIPSQQVYEILEITD